jgi:hypothetical protein
VEIFAQTLKDVQLRYISDPPGYLHVWPSAMSLHSSKMKELKMRTFSHRKSLRRTSKRVSRAKWKQAFERLESRLLMSGIPEYAQLLANDGAADDRFGWAVDISGDYAFCGAFADDNLRGAVYVYQRSGSGWTLSGKLLASDVAEGDQFGGSVSVDGEWAIIGAESVDLPGKADAGAAYVFHLQSGVWTEYVKLIPLNASLSLGFGHSVSISGDSVIVARFGSTNLWNSGSADVFHRDGAAWVHQATLAGSDMHELDQFGYSAAIYGDYAIVSSRLHDHAGVDATGGAYIFHRSGSTWTQQAELQPSESGFSQFGYQVAIGADVAMVSGFSGPAYIYQRNGSSWAEKAKIIPDDFPDANMAAVDISTDYAILGHRYEGHAGASCGAAYVFVPSGDSWVQKRKLVASNAAAEDNFGCAVAVDGEEVLAGALFANPGGVSDAGAVYAFNLTYPVTIPLDARGKATYIDASGEQVTVQLTGGGTGTIYFTDSGHQDAALIRLDQTTVNSALTITVKGTDTTLGELDLGAGSLKLLNASKTTLNGAGIHSSAGSIGTISLGDILEGADILLPGTGSAAGVAITAQYIPGDTDIFLGGALKSLTALQWEQGELQATWAGNLTLKGDKNRQLPGDIGATITLSSQDVKGTSLSKLTTWGTVNSASISMPGAFGAAEVGAWAEGSLSAYSLKSLTAKGFKPASIVGDCRANVTLTGEAGIVMVAGKMQCQWDCLAIKSVTVKRDLSDATFKLSRGTDPKLQALGNLTVTGIAEYIDILTPGAVGAVAVGKWFKSSLTSDTLKSVSVKGFAPGSLPGDMEEVLLDVRAIGSISVAGMVQSAEWKGDSIQSVKLSHDASDLDITLDLAPDPMHPALGSLRVTGVADGLTVHASGVVGAVSVGKWHMSDLSADYLKSLSVMGYRPGALVGDMEQALLEVREIGSISVAGGVNEAEWNADSIQMVMVSGDVTGLAVTLDLAVDPKLLALKTLSVGGWFIQSRIFTPGNMGQLTFAAMQNSNVFAGILTMRDVNAADGVWDLPEAADVNLVTPATITQLTITGKRRNGEGFSFLNNNIGAAVMETFAVAYTDTSNNGVIFGEIADRVGKFTVKDDTGTYVYRNLTVPADSNGFEDVILRII